MIVLAVDTSSNEGSLALGKAPNAGAQIKILGERKWSKKAMHSEIATLELQELLAATQTDIHQISHIMVNHGPGSFTGIRVGLNLARTLAFSLKLPIAQQSALEIAAMKVFDSGKTALIYTHALQNFYYAARFRFSDQGLERIQEPASLTDEEIQTISQKSDIVVGEVHTLARDLLDGLSQWPVLANFKTWRDIHPLYIRASEAEEKMRRGDLKPQ